MSITSKSFLGTTGFTEFLTLLKSLTDTKQDSLTAGTGIIISDDNEISVDTELLAYSDLLEASLAYGVEKDLTQSSPTWTRIGSSELHQTCPVQNSMYGVTLTDDGEENVLLDNVGWADEYLNGDYGQVMMAIPEFYYKFEYDDEETPGEGTMRFWLSQYNIEGYTKHEKEYMGVYEATLDTTDGTSTSTAKLCSVKSTETQYRGGCNISSLDDYEEGITQLGTCRHYISLTSGRSYARNRGSSDEYKWNITTSDQRLLLAWLFISEYATFNSQLEYNSEKTSEGYNQGGLGTGCTNLTDMLLRTYRGCYLDETNYNTSGLTGAAYLTLPIGLTDYEESGTTSLTYTLPDSYSSTVQYTDDDGNAGFAEWEEGGRYYVGQLVGYNEVLYIKDNSPIYGSSTPPDEDTDNWIAKYSPYKGTYSDSTTYDVGDYVYYSNYVYKITAIDDDGYATSKSAATAYGGYICKWVGTITEEETLTPRGDTYISYLVEGDYVSIEDSLFIVGDGVVLENDGENNWTGTALDGSTSLSTSDLYENPTVYIGSTTTQEVTYIPRYHGIEHPFGHIYKAIDGVLILNDELYTSSDPQYFCDGSGMTADEIPEGYTDQGTLYSGYSYIKYPLVGSSSWCELGPSTGGGSSSTYLCDYIYNANSASNPTTVYSLRSGGYAYNGSRAGLLAFYANPVPSDAVENSGVRLSYIPWA